MYLESTKTNVNVSELLQSVIVNETVNYIERVISINTTSSDRIHSFLKDLIAEFTVMCSIRNFTLLNTNVVKGNQLRILENDTIRTYYFEMYKSVFRCLDLDYSMLDREKIFDALMKTSMYPPCVNVGTSNQLIRMDQEYKNLLGALYVDKIVLQEYLQANPWYIMVILTNISAPKLIENVTVLLTAK